MSHAFFEGTNKMYNLDNRGTRSENAHIILEGNETTDLAFRLNEQVTYFA